MKILITGANGLVGGRLCQRLLSDGMDVRMAVRSLSASLDSPDQIVVGSIDSATDWCRALANVSVVIHLAARVHVMNDMSDDPLSEFRRVNTHGTLNLARQAALTGVKRMVFVSSVKVNGEATLPNTALTELDEPCPQDAYGQSKLEAEVGLRQIASETGMEICIVRPPLVYGPGVKANFAALMQAVQKGWPLPLGAVHNKRSMVGIDNLVDFIGLCAVHPSAANQTFFISDGQDLSTAELIDGLALASGKTSHLLPVPVWLLLGIGRLLGKGEQVKRLCGSLQVDCSKAQKLLHWHPPVSVAEGLHRAVYSLNSS